MTIDQGLEVGPLADEEVQAFGALIHQALFWPPLEEVDWTLELGREHIRVLRQRGRVVAGLAALPMGQWFGGRSVPAAAVTTVGVAPEHRSGGTGSALLAGVLRELHERGCPLSVLYPSTQPFYRRAGYEQAGARIGYRLPTHAIDARDRALGLREIEPGNHDLVRALYAERARRTAGHLDRNEWLWNGILNNPQRKLYGYLVEGDGDAEGYIVYRQQHQPGALGGEILVRDLVALTSGAARRLLTFLADHRSTIESVLWYGAPADPLFTFIANQAHKVEWQMDWLLRIVDVRGALAARGYPPGAEVEVHLAVRDDLLPANDGQFVLTVSNGQGEVREGGRGGLRVDVRGLATLYSGRLSPEELRATGLLDGEPRDLAAAALAFAGPAPWMPDMF